MSALIIKPPDNDTYINSNIPYQNFNDYYALFVGKYPPDVIYRSLLSFDLSQLPKGYIIKKAELELYIIRNDNPSYTKYYNISRVRENFDYETVNYVNQPTISTEVSGTLIVNNELNSYITADITPLVRSWYNGEYPNYGLMIYSADETVDSLLAFYSMDSTDELFIPKLNIYLESSNEISSRFFYSNSKSGVTTNNSYTGSTIYDISKFFNYTYFIKNTGSNLCETILQISPNSTDWINDSDVKLINPGEVVAIVPKKLSNYTRLAYKSSQLNKSTTIDIYLQAQT
ncbi:DNRLRE domain-containing protein [Dethiothermospora halolimnae]|uniref:DNRLRE domain-containing protein n=1 Tax=Dethiothermospora halolimnae TaxID=3114390 RepID=UPI003CCBB2E9